MHGEKSAPRDTKCVPIGPIIGFGRSLYVTVILPRNETGSNGNKTKVYFILFTWSGKKTLHVARSSQCVRDFRVMQTIAVDIELKKTAILTGGKIVTPF